MIGKMVDKVMYKVADLELDVKHLWSSQENRGRKRRRKMEGGEIMLIIELLACLGFLYMGAHYFIKTIFGGEDNESRFLD